MICIKENIIGETITPPPIQAKHNTKVLNKKSNTKLLNKEKQIHKYDYQLPYQELLKNQLIFNAQLDTIYTDIYIAIAIYIDIDRKQGIVL